MVAWGDKEWEAFEQVLRDEIGRELSDGQIDYPTFWDDYNQCTTHGFSREERRQRTKFRNWRCVHDPNRLDAEGNPDPDPTGQGRCEVVLRAKRLSFKPGGFHLVWFDDPFDKGDFAHPVAAISVAVWVASHQVTEEPDDLVAAANELCAVPKPLHASFKYRMDHSFTQPASFNVTVTPHEACE